MPALQKKYKDRIKIATPEITQSHIQELFEYRDGNLFRKVAMGSAGCVGDMAGWTQAFKKGHGRIEYRRKINLYNKQYFQYRLIFLYHHGFLPKMIDHIDGDPLNDKIENLRASTTSQNGANTKSRKNPYKGPVKYTRKNGSVVYAVQVRKDGKRIHVGTFDTIEKAALAYNRAAVMAHGEYANLNIIKPQST